MFLISFDIFLKNFSRKINIKVFFFFLIKEDKRVRFDNCIIKLNTNTIIYYPCPVQITSLVPENFHLFTIHPFLFPQSHTR